VTYHIQGRLPKNINGYLITNLANQKSPGDAIKRLKEKNPANQQYGWQNSPSNIKHKYLPREAKAEEVCHH
jgi:hypothetical protein